MAITAAQVNDLRQRTGAGMMDCKRALEEANGDIQKAIEILRKKGASVAAKRAEKSANEGLVVTKLSDDKKFGTILEINCETDFVAKTDEYKELVKDVAMHIAATSPSCVRREEIPSDVIEKEKMIYASQVENKPAQVVEKIVAGKLEKFYTDTCLMDQIFVKDPEGKKKIKDLVTEKVAKLGENIVIKRFVRFQLGEKVG